MSVLSIINKYISRRRRIQHVTSVARRYSREAYPQDMPIWSMVAEEDENECVVYVTYEQGDVTTTVSPHRFFKVRLPDLSVTALQENYYPTQWGTHC